MLSKYEVILEKNVRRKKKKEGRKTKKGQQQLPAKQVGVCQKTTTIKLCLKSTTYLQRQQKN